ncbi:MAG: hypothetical protein Q7T11_04025, partial [Deltaproteobacteria bacterium]|nr:hypothetical protein [Deltaproteobacteria bacterium]
AEEVFGRKIRLIPVPLWTTALAALANQAWFTCVKREAPMLGWDKFQEVRQTSWTCEGEGSTPTGLREGFGLTRAWYEKEKWL